MRRVIVLRPEPGASETVERARRRGLDAVAIPLFTIEPVEWKVPDPGDFDGLLLSSANAVRSAGPGLETLHGLPVFAVGEATAAAANDAGLNIADTGDGGVDALLAAIDSKKRLLHLCGEDRRMPANASQEIMSVAVYRSMALEPPARLAETRDSVVLIHSPRSARRLAELIDDRATIAIVAISPAAAEAVGVGWKAVEASAVPTDDALLALAEQLCDKAPRG